eukprot:SAG31_NODE_14488_length_803_cov_4.301136_2_plen_152_part_00
MSINIAKVHPVGQALTSVAKKYQLPEEVEKKIQDSVFCNMFTMIPRLPIIHRNVFYEKSDKLGPNSIFKELHVTYNFGIEKLILFDNFIGNINIYGLCIRYSHKFNCMICDIDIIEIKATVEELLKYNNMKIPISKLKKNELISLLIHTEF